MVEFIRALHVLRRTDKKSWWNYGNFYLSTLSTLFKEHRYFCKYEKNFFQWRKIYNYHTDLDKKKYQNKINFKMAGHWKADINHTHTLLSLCLIASQKKKEKAYREVFILHRKHSRLEPSPSDSGQMLPCHLLIVSQRQLQLFRCLRTTQ